MTEPSTPMGKQQRGNGPDQREPSDPVERADKRRESIVDPDTGVASDRTVHQREHGSMDASLVAKEKDHPWLDSAIDGFDLRRHARLR